MEEEDLFVHILLDVSHSMGMGEPSKSLYSKQLAQFRLHFSEDQMLLVLTEDLHGNPAATWRQLSPRLRRWLALPASMRPRRQSRPLGMPE